MKDYSMYEGLKEAVLRANVGLEARGLVICSWGNVSEIDRAAGVVAIKPSGVAYDELTADRIVCLNLEGEIVDGDLKPSSDTATHLELYRNFKQVGGICHTHSVHAAMWAQACREIPCFGTTHADYFYGAVPVTEAMSRDEIESDYEVNTGKVIVRRFADIDPMQMRAILVANHGPFTWGGSAAEAVEAAVVLEQVALMALGTVTINPGQEAIGQILLNKHYLRKHGTGAYYGQEH